MFAKSLSILLAISLLHVLTAKGVPAQANLADGSDRPEKVTVSDSNAPTGTKESKEARFASKVKAAIAKLGSGPAARVEVKLRDKTKLKGYVDVVNDDSFVVVDDKTGVATTVLYPQVQKVKGNNLSTGAKIAIGIGIAILIILIFIGNAKGNG